MAERPDNPYPGPRPFMAREAGLFFGRRATTRRLCSLLLTHRAVLLFGPSGAGKSSLVSAGLVPSLAEREVRVLPTARVLAELEPQALPPGANVFTAAALASLATSPSASGPPGGESLADGLARVLGGFDADTQVFLHLDQLEELFKAHAGLWPQRQDFCRQLTLALDRFPRVLALISIREDYLAPLEALAPWLPDRLRTRLRLEPLTREEAVAAVVGPAQAQSVDFEEAAARKLVEDLATVQVGRPGEPSRSEPGPTVEPVHLQVVCSELWQRTQAQGPCPITAGALGEAGRADVALARYYQEAVKAAATAEVSQAQIRTWIGSRLVSAGGARQPVLRGEGAGLPEPVIETMVGRHLLREESRGTARWIELAHDRLVRPVLESNRASLAGASPLEKHALDWSEAAPGHQEVLLRFGLASLRQWRRARRREARERAGGWFPGWWRAGREWLRPWRRLPGEFEDPLTRRFVATCVEERERGHSRQRRVIGWLSFGGVLALLSLIVLLVGAVLRSFLTFGRPGRLSEEALLQREVEPQLALLLARESIYVDWIHFREWPWVRAERVQNGRVLADLLARPSERLAAASSLEGPWLPGNEMAQGGGDAGEIPLPATAAVAAPDMLRRAWWQISQARPRLAIPPGTTLRADAEGSLHLSPPSGLDLAAADRLVGRAPGPLTLLALSPPVGHYLAPGSRRARRGETEHLIAGFAPGWGIYLWHLPTRSLAAGPLGEPQAEWVSLAFAGDGKALFAVDSRGSGRRFELDPDRWAQLACNLAGRDFTRQEAEHFLPQGEGWDRSERSCQPELRGTGDER
ncbi:MAG TPA: AAA family ATPase [Thermoanaerobaculia bacterium]|nr:AAA family ATPase [Thermoanaerobaculia bacterium]